MTERRPSSVLKHTIGQHCDVIRIRSMGSGKIGVAVTSGVLEEAAVICDSCVEILCGMIGFDYRSIPKNLNVALA